MRYTSNLDVQKSWERTFRRAKLPIAYSQGFHPQPKIQLACPLPLGFLSENELLDFILENEMEISEIKKQLIGKTPPGIEIHNIEVIDNNQPSLQVQSQSAKYRIEFLEPVNKEKVMHDCQLLLEKSEIIRVRRGKTYDLRPLILQLSVEGEKNTVVIKTMLAAKEKATGRPEEILSELSIPFQTTRITREATIVNNLNP